MPHTAYAEQRLALRSPAVETSQAGALRLGRAYWEEVAAFSRGLVRPRQAGEGVDLVILRTVTLLRFGPAETTVSSRDAECRYPIRGGLLATGPGGYLVLAQHGGETVELVLAVEGFQPRLAADGRLRKMRRTLFDALQVPLHDRVSRRFLARAARGEL